MSFFLGFIPTQESNYKIRKVVGDLGRVFDGQSVNVRWSKPESFNIPLLNLGENLNPIKRELLLYKLRKLNWKKFTVELDKANVGISRGYKELIYLTLGEGGDTVRNYLFQIRNVFRTKQDSLFIPHITLGRISKDLSGEEYRNLVLDVRNTNANLNIPEITFTVDSLCLVSIDSDGNHTIIKRVPLL
jgi:2'-5' RNA ligase